MVAALCVCLALSPIALADPVAGVSVTSGLDHGFSGLYNLDFVGAQRDFAGWQAQHPEDPMGPVSEGAGYLFSEFNRLGVLEAQFYENDDAFSGRSTFTADPVAKNRFMNALNRAETLARARLAKNPKDSDALFAMTLSSGLQADYAALIEKRNMASLHHAKQASTWAQQLLAVCHDCYDAHLATGFTNPADKQGGIADLQLTAERGHYLAPFARILLAIAYVREKDKPHALQMLTALRADFPGNGLFPREIARLQASH